MKCRPAAYSIKVLEKNFFQRGKSNILLRDSINRKFLAVGKLSCAWSWENHHFGSLYGDVRHSWLETDVQSPSLLLRRTNRYKSSDELQAQRFRRWRPGLKTADHILLTSIKYISKFEHDLWLQGRVLKFPFRNLAVDCLTNSISILSLKTQKKLERFGRDYQELSCVIASWQIDSQTDKQTVIKISKFEISKFQNLESQNPWKRSFFSAQLMNRLPSRINWSVSRCYKYVHEKKLRKSREYIQKVSWWWTRIK